MRGDLGSDARRKVNTLVIIDVHAREIIDGFVRDSVMDASAFAWESQLRFYWDRAQVRRRAGARELLVANSLHVRRIEGPQSIGIHQLCRPRAPPITALRPAPLPPQDDLLVRQCTGLFRYGYEYMGQNGRLVITALTDR